MVSITILPTRIGDVAATRDGGTGEYLPMIGVYLQYETGEDA